MDGLMRGSRKHGTSSLMLSISKVLPKSIRRGVREITSLHTPKSDRSKGMASMLMRNVCNEADNNGVVLMLMPDDGLAEFYEQFGFETIQSKPRQLMARSTNG